MGVVVAWGVIETKSDAGERGNQGREGNFGVGNWECTENHAWEEMKLGEGF